MSNSQKVVNVSLKAAKDGVSNAIRELEAARKAVCFARAAILAALEAILEGSLGTEDALNLEGHVSAQDKVRFLRSYCRFEKNAELHNERLRKLAFITSFGKIRDLDVAKQEAMITSMTRGQGRKALERFVVEGLRPLDNAVAEFRRCEAEAETAERNVTRAKARENDEYRKIGVRR